MNMYTCTHVHVPFICSVLSQEEIERKLMEQMNEKFQLTEMQLRKELAKKVQVHLHVHVRVLFFNT